MTAAAAAVEKEGLEIRLQSNLLFAETFAVVVPLNEWRNDQAGYI